MKHAYLAIGFVTAALFLSAIFAAMNVFIGFVLLFYSLSPFLVIWMVWVVLKHGSYTGRELSEEEEFGYADWDHKLK